MATIAELTCYPIKGCAGIPLSAAPATGAGFQHDRSFMVVDGKGVFRSQRRDPLLALVEPTVSDDGEWLTLRAPGEGPARVKVDLTSPPQDVFLFGMPCKGIDQGDTAAAWLSRVLGSPSHLVRVPPGYHRITDGQIPGMCGYADSGAVHLTSVSSWAALNVRIAEQGGEPVPMDRFRCNIVVDGWDDPHTEDRMRRIGIGDAVLGYGKLAIRCAVTMVGQESGGNAGPEPIRTLASYRRAAGGGVAFGIKLAVLQPGKLAVGDEVTVTSWGASELTGPEPG